MLAHQLTILGTQPVYPNPAANPIHGATNPYVSSPTPRDGRDRANGAVFAKECSESALLTRDSENTWLFSCGCVVVGVALLGVGVGMLWESSWQGVVG